MKSFQDRNYLFCVTTTEKSSNYDKNSIYFHKAAKKENTYIAFVLFSLTSLTKYDKLATKQSRMP